MKATSLLAAVLLVLALSPELLGQDEPEIIIFQHIEDQPLDKIATQIAALGGLRVEVEPALREKQITLDLEVPVAEALKQIAEAAGAHLVKTGAKSYAIRSKPGSGEETEEIPEWIRPLAKRLDETEVTFLWQGEPLPEILEWLAKQSGVRIRLDPRVLRERSKEDLEIHIAEYDDNLEPSSITSSAASALDLALVYPTADLARVWRFGGIFVSTQKHIRELPPAPRRRAGEGGFGEDVASARVTVKLRSAKLDHAIQKIARKARVKIRFGRALRKAFADDRVDLDVEDQPLLDVLDLLLAPRNLVVTAGDGGLVVQRAETR